MRIWILIFFASHFALAEGSGGTVNSLNEGVKFLVSKRGSVTWGQGEINNLNISAVSKTPSLTSYTSEFDVLMPLSLHIGFRETLTQSAEMSFNGSAPQRGEIYLSIGELGLKLFLPFGHFQPWLGAGYIYGSAAFTNPQTRGNDTYLAAFENETHSIWGSYAQGGVDLFLTDVFGIRAYYQQDDIHTERYYNLQTSGNSHFQLARWAVGIVGLVP